MEGAVAVALTLAEEAKKQLTQAELFRSFHMIRTLSPKNCRTSQDLGCGFLVQSSFLLMNMMANRAKAAAGMLSNLFILSTKWFGFG